MARRALCVGINDYPGTGSDLAGCINDANDWTEVLEARGFEVARLLDREATRSSIVAELRRLVSASGAGDILIFQFSGHGSWVPDEDGDEPDARDEVLCPHDISRSGPLTDDDLHAIFSARKPGARVVVIADSCHSGTVSRFRRTAAPVRGAGHRVRFLPPREFLSGTSLRALGRWERRAAASPPGRRSALLLSGCLETEFSYDAVFRGRPNGAFTHAAIRALARLPEGASYLEWYGSIRRALPTAEYPQTPTLHGSSAEKRWRALADAAGEERAAAACGGPGRSQLASRSRTV